jgi:glycosyltransferase involved in cell wall biosynthesis
MSPAAAALRPTPSISCVMPAYNEASNLSQVLPQVLQALRALAPRVELIVVDDGGATTVAVVQALARHAPEIVCLELSRNFGKEAAITAGLSATRGEVVLIMDADGQHPCSLLPEMLARWREGCDVVYAVRATRHDQSSLQARLTGVFYRLVNWGNRVQIPPNAGDFRLMGRPVVDALNALPERNRFMKGLYAWVGFKSTAIDYEPLARGQGVSRFGWKGSISLALTGIVTFSSAPLRMLALLGLLLAMAAFTYGGGDTGLRMGHCGAGLRHHRGQHDAAQRHSAVGHGHSGEYVGRIYDRSSASFLVQRRSGAGLPPPSAPDEHAP